MQLTLGEITNTWLARARDGAALWCYAHLHCAHIQLVSVQISSFLVCTAAEALLQTGANQQEKRCGGVQSGRA